MAYYYDDEVKDSLVDFINEREDEWHELVRDGKDFDDIREWLYDEAWVSDSVTGNASGSYYCNAYKAEEALAHNWELLEEALDDFGYPSEENPIAKGAEWCDVTVRCYMLGQVIEDAMEECGIRDYIENYEEEDGNDDEE